jgi:hypothetical protein
LLNYFKESSKYQLPLRCLPEGVCPLHFPVIIEKRDLLYSLLKKEGICGHDWWGDFHPDVPWNEYPDIVYMKKHIFGFPIHQDLTPYQLEMILKLFENIMNHLQK